MDYSKLSVGDVLAGIDDTQRAVRRASELLERAARAGIAPKIPLGNLAQSTFRLRSHLEDDLAQLEAALDNMGG